MGRALAYGFTEERAKCVKDAFVSCGVAPERISTRGWGKSRPLVWAVTEPAGSPNRRVELYFSCGSFETPRRRALSEYAVAPGAPPLSADDEAAEPGDGASESEIDEGEPTTWIQLPSGGTYVVPVTFLLQYQHYQRSHAARNLLQ
eukprot:NODE_5329_length_592_cov_136.046555.p1 GENE.NODE_5329_length_592_cov_136.046555~~NODE_5329_length_592_cov_136.046555.p1  ORF type:complete len:146 (+),score=26.40 NODE_5329_length_592_cov_136.046555:3-440(+)